MISYEVAMGLALVAVFLHAGSMSTSEIVESQKDVWFAFTLIPSFVIYMIAMVGETNRAPFDLPEAEGELVGGFHTEYSSLKFALFFLAEYINMATVSALATTLFLGGWRAPWPISLWDEANQGYWPFFWFMGKVLFFIFLFIWLRGTLPRLRYDQFMGFGWKVLIPISIVWIVAVAGIRVIDLKGGFDPRVLIGAAAVLALIAVASLFIPEKQAPEESGEAEPFDAFAGGYPVPPMPVPGPALIRARTPWRKALMATLKEQLWDPVAGFGVTFRTMFRKVVTEQYPFDKQPTAPRFHGRHQLNRWPDGLEKCIGCELCAWACPADAIYVEGASNADGEGAESGRFSPGERYGRVYQINYLRCILCGLCIEACPTRALTMTNEYELADNNRADLIYEKTDLLAPLLPGMEQPPHPMRLGEDEGDYYRGTLRRQDQPGPEPVRRRRHRFGRRRWVRMIAFWILAPVMVICALGLLFARKAVHCAMLLAVVMISLAVLYAVQDAPFLFAVQIIVYTGAILMLFLFVLMLVGVDASDSVVETIRGQRLFAVLVGLLFGATLVIGVAQVSLGVVTGLDEANADGNVPGIARLLFTRYVFAFEVTSALLITAALGAMVLAHRERLTPKLTQSDLAAQRMRDYAEHGKHPGPLPPPGVFARHNAVDTPALLPDGTPSDASISRVLAARGTVKRSPGSAGQVERIGGSDETVPPRDDSGTAGQR